MTVRDAGFADIKKIARLCERIRGRSRFEGMTDPIDVDLVKGIMMDAVLASDRGDVKVLVSDHNGDLNGMFVGTRQRLYDITNAHLASCSIWYVDEGVSPLVAMRLARTFIRWAEQADGPLVIRFGLNDSINTPEAAARSLEKLEGFRRSGIIMEKEIR